MADLPLVISTSGLVPQAPATLRAALLASVAGVQPGYTADLPASLIEDMASTSVAALLQADSSLVDLVNSIGVRTANPWLLTQLGQLYGVPASPATNTSVYVVFSGPPGFVVVQGFTVSDGTYNYVAQQGAIIAASGTTSPVYCVSPTSGSWAVAAGTVTELATSVPSAIALSCTNPNTGTPGLGAQDEASYRVAVQDACLAGGQGMARYLKTLLNQVAGVQPRLVSPVMNASGTWKIVVGGGDPYQVAYAIYMAMGGSIATLVGSVMAVAGVTNANPAVITTTLNHGYVTGQTVTMTGATGLTALNGVPLVAVVLSQTTFSVPVNTTSSGTYTGNGVMSPNARNVLATINDYPDKYLIPFISPPQQTVTMAVTWNTLSPYYVSPVTVASLVGPALVAYVNGIYSGQPMNLFDLQATFRKALAGTVPAPLITRLVFAVSINGIGVAATAGTGIIAGDPESFFYATLAGIIVTQG